MNSLLILPEIKFSWSISEQAYGFWKIDRLRWRIIQDMTSPEIVTTVFTPEQMRKDRDGRLLEDLTEIWNAACGTELSITPGFMDYNLRPSTGIVQMGSLAARGGMPVGFALASCAAGEGMGEQAWIDAVAVRPEAQRRGVGRALLEWATSWLASLGCHRVNLGTSMRPFTPGLPSDLNPEPFLRLGFQQTGSCWDLSANIKEFQPRFPRPAPGVEVRCLQAGETDQLLAFLREEFPGRWNYEVEEHLREGSNPADILILWEESQIRGFCRVTYEGSDAPIERFYLQKLPHPWGQAGTYGVAAGQRGRGLGLYLIQQSLVNLQSRGVDGCIIDWTNYLDLYGKFGFIPYRQYRMLSREI